MRASRVVITWSTAGLAVWATAAWAADPEQMCQARRAKAAGKYAQCIQNEVAKHYSGVDNDLAKVSAKVAACVTKYGATWGKLQAKAQASPGVETCDAARFVDNGDGTVVDNLSALQWEKKTDDGTIHDKDDLYSWSSAGTAADGTAFTTFVAALNTAGFAGQHDWRLPTFAELLSIVEPAYPCAPGPCVDPTFGPTLPQDYYSSSTFQPLTTKAWLVSFYNGFLTNIFKVGPAYVRGVRGGL